MASGNDPVAGIEAARAHQRALALAQANEMKQARAELKRLMREGKLDPFELLAGGLEDWEPIIASWKVGKLLKAIPRIGDARTLEILVAFQASPQTRIRAFPPARRRELARIAKGSIDITVL